MPQGDALIVIPQGDALIVIPQGEALSGPTLPPPKLAPAW
jgi:hypothetical protein